MYPTKPTTIICNVRVSACHEWYWRRHSYRRSFDDSACLDDLLLVQLRARTVEVADDGGHAGLVAHGGGQVALLLRVVLWEAGKTLFVSLFLLQCCTGHHCFGIAYDLTFPLWRAARLRGKKASEPWRGASNFRCDMVCGEVLSISCHSGPEDQKLRISTCSFWKCAGAKSGIGPKILARSCLRLYRSTSTLTHGTPISDISSSTASFRIDISLSQLMRPCFIAPSVHQSDSAKAAPPAQVLTLIVSIHATHSRFTTV